VHPSESRSALGPEDEQHIEFLLRLGRALHRYGYPSPNLEAALTRLADRFGLDSQFFSTPTSINLAFGPLAHQRTFMLRVEPGETSLERMAELHGVIRDVIENGLSSAAASLRVEEILRRPGRYPRWLQTISFGLASGGAALFLGGGVLEVVPAIAIGWVIGLLARLGERSRGVRAIFEPVAAALAAFFAASVAHWMGAFSIYTATLAGLIVLLPGFSLTVALTELATRHLVSGTARLAGAATLFLTISFGVAVGTRVALALYGPIPTAPPIPPLAWTELLALLVAPLAFVVLLRAAPRDAPWIVLTAIIAVVSGRIGVSLLGAEWGSVLGAFAVGLASNAYSRALGRPAQITQVPGILLLVPGAIGFKSLASILDRDIVLGIETLFRMAFVAVSLVAGLLLSNVVLPSRRDLARTTGGGRGA
jgi:uncharacterized membrane protein YjjP (DUF1212 family)